MRSTNDVNFLAVKAPKPRRYKTPTPTEQLEFTLQLHFGRDPDRMKACVHRAYLDLCRTLHGFRAFPKATVLSRRAHAKVQSSLLALSLNGCVDQDSFDKWHRKACAGLCKLYTDQNFKFGIGQAQKWINMAFKYLFVFGEEKIPGYADLYKFGHVPLDNWMLEKFAAHEAQNLSSAWSRMRDYGEYFKFQSWIRRTFSDSVPLAVEFRMYQETAGQTSSPKRGA
jgi:hypothetical protein